MRYRLTALAALLLAALLALFGCGVVRGSGKVVTEDRQIGDVSRVEVQGIGRLEVTQGSPAKLTVQADDNLMRYIKTETQGDRLVISVERLGIPFVMVDPSTMIVYRLQLPGPQAIGLSGSGEVVASGLEVTRLNVDISGSGKAEITDLRADTFAYQLSGSGSAEVSGRVDSADVNVSGSGRLTAGELEAKTVSISISGSGDATVWATEKLDASISGSGSVKYYGSPSVSQQVSGSGNLTSLGAK